MKLPHIRFARGAAAMAALVLTLSPAFADNWYGWRGPSQDGRSAEKYAKQAFKEQPLWKYDLQSRGSPVAANGRVFVFGYHGEGELLQETLTCLDAKTGKRLWEKTFSDFLSDVSYSRYAIGAPAIDPETGNVYLVSQAGEFVCVDRDGNQKFYHSLMEENGRLTFPNGRNGAPVIVGDLVIVRGITANWGGDGPARDRLYAFHKITGEPVWVSTPGITPHDNSFGTGFLQMWNGIPAMYLATGCGNYAAINALTGKPLWRWHIAKGGINSSAIVVDGKMICIHDKENVDRAEIGRMTALNVPEKPLPPGPPDDPVPVISDPKAEAWRLPFTAETSSPVYADGILFQVVTSGVLNAVDPADGKPLWNIKLGPGNLHSSPAWANGLLYVPILNDTASEDGLLYVIKPSKDKGEILHKVKLEGFCFGAPAIMEGKLYVTTTKHTYCFEIGQDVSGKGEWFTLPKAPAGPPAALQIMPQEFTLFHGKPQAFTIRGIDAKGFVTGPVTDAKWESFIPPTAKVRATLDAAFNDKGELVPGPEAKVSGGAFKATSGNAFGVVRGRLLQSLPFVEDFEKMPINQLTLADNVTVKPLVASPGPAAPTAPVVATAEEIAAGTKFAYPPLPWMGARFKWEVREMDGNKVLAKTLNNIFFQRATSFIGSPAMSNYTMQADVMTDGNRRLKSEVGLINQRYLISLRGNANELDVSSNQERLKVSVPFTIAAKKWYTLKTRVDLNPDGSGVVRAKAWTKGEPEPEKWTIEVPHKIAHTHGCPGFYGFALQVKHAVYIDNLSVTPNK
ncbi:MAG TPA: PQQ-binding-like beta-propeller repeat protein [Verrucomicrobiales bacterium]|jgi:outer membrane protein assembly factor BamB|nr:PQQ-binding-like beta-propeller repeat protein [Verrucomicrobiales bacterium]